MGDLSSERFYIFPMLLILIVSIVGNIVQKIVYKKEIDRLSSERSEILQLINARKIPFL